MTESEWFHCTDPRAMLEFLRQSGRASDSKLRLFACHACRHSLGSHGCFEDEAEDALVMAEWSAAGEATLEDLIEEREDFLRFFDPATESLLAMMDAVAPTMATPMTVDDAIRVVLVLTEYHSQIGVGPAADEQDYQCDVLREIVGNPFRPVSLSPAWLTWHGGTIPKLAQAIYDERTFDRLPILADALEGAGCTDAEILGHCRGPGPHVRGCFVVDALLGKN
jgi:hypothetical protein